jgi:hypothetical protein
VEAARIMPVLAAETSTQEDATTQGSATILIKDAEDWAALAERETREGVSRVEPMSAIALGSAREEPGGPVQSSHGLFDAAADAKRV